MGDEEENTQNSNRYDEHPQQEDLRYPPFGSRLLIQIEVYSANYQA
jgi:hypothetical protein